MPTRHSLSQKKDELRKSILVALILKNTIGAISTDRGASLFEIIFNLS